MAEILDTPKMDGVGRETPMIHGWITPEYAMQMIENLINFLIENNYYTIIDYMKEGQPGKIRFYKCPFTIMNAPNVT